MEPFIPKGTKIPSTSNYLKLAAGENTFRILSSAVIGYEYFNDKKRPIRSRKEPMGLPKDIGYKDGRPNPIRYFWAFVIWNYNDERIQIAEFTQQTILVPLEALYNNGKWGDPQAYDITIKKNGSTMQDTEYSVVPNPKEAIKSEILENYKAKKINLEALFTNEDPFASESRIVQSNGLPQGVKVDENDIDPDSIPF